MIGIAEEHIDRLIRQRINALAAQIVETFKHLGSESRTSGDDSGLDDVWEEFKEQVQDGAGIYFSAYEETIQSLCRASIDELSPFEFQVLWYATDGYADWDEEAAEQPLYDKNDLVKELCSRIEGIAMNEPLRRDEEEENEDEEPDEDEETEDESEQTEEDPFVKDTEPLSPSKSPAANVRQDSLFE